MCLAYVWPHETAQAVATDRVDDKYAICTVETQPLAQLGAFPEAVFVLDFLTGRLTGALINQQSFAFTNFWFRNIAADFNLKPNAASKAKYVIIPGNTNLVSGGGETMATASIYVGELTSGKVVCYSFMVRNSKVPLPVAPLEPVAFFNFREQVADN
jgi:hypothetical protein